MLDHFQAFVAAAKHGSFTGAAQAMKMTNSTMSRRIQELESYLGAELFHRNPQGLELTITGRRYYQECAGYLNELKARIDNLQKSINSLEGTLTVAVPTNIGSGPLDDFWARFSSRYPQIRLKIHLTDPLHEQWSVPIDLGIQSGSRRNSPLIQERIGEIATVLVMSSHFSDENARQVETLDRCPSVAADLFNQWELFQGEDRHLLQKQHVHTSNDMTVILSLVKAGAGIAMLPLSMVQRDLENGSLTRILPSWSGRPREIYLVRPHQRTMSIRAKRFQEELLVFLAEQAWFHGSGTHAGA